MKVTPTPHLRPGLDFVAYELDRQIQINSELSNTILELESKIQSLERIIESYQNNPSGSNNVVLL